MKNHSPRARRNPSAKVPEVRERFTGKVQTQYGGAGLLRRFVLKLGLPMILGTLGDAQGGAASPLGRYLLCVLSALLLGLQRQCEIASLRKDPAAMMALGLSWVPAQCMLSRFFQSCSRPLSEQLMAANADLTRRLRDGRVGATIDLDGTVVVTRGNPGGASFGYNPKRKGSKSYFMLMSFWGETRDVTSAQLLGGHRAVISAEAAKEAYRRSHRALPDSVKRVRVRADSGFYSHSFLSYLESQKVTYTIAARVHEPLGVQVVGLQYRPVDERKTNGKWAVAECEYQAKGWARPRRMVVIRERLDPENPSRQQLKLFECEGYAYQVIATNAAWSAVGVWHFYNDRSRLENIIKESQYDFGSDHIISKRVGGNATWMALSVLAYNVTNWFREKVLGQRGHRHMAHWLRNQLIRIPATLIYSARRYYLNIWEGQPGRELFEQALQTLEVLTL